MDKLFKLFIFFISINVFSQAGHLMQGVGAVNMSMGGAATGQPLDINGALLWNPAAIAAFDSTMMSFDIGLFYGSPEVSSSLPANMMYSGSPATQGTTQDVKKASPMPALGIVWGNAESKNTFGISVFGVSGFGVDFPAETNNPSLGSGWDPNHSNVVFYPQNMGGFGNLKSNYMMLQVGFAWAYKFSDKFSVGIQPTFDYEALELAPNPTSSPSPTKGYPTTNNANATGFGGQIGLFFDSGKGFKAGASYKTVQSFSDFKFENTYLDGTAAPENKFKMDFPAIISLGMGYSNEALDLALDYRFVDYENTAGFEEKGWSSTASVKGFGWKNMSIISAGVQYKGLEKLPLRVGYTYSSNPIDNELAFFSLPATAIIKHAFQFGAGYEIGDSFKLNAVYHHGTSGGKTEGKILNPGLVSPTNPYGAIPGSTVGYEMSTDLLMIGISYNFKK